MACTMHPPLVVTAVAMNAWDASVSLMQRAQVEAPYPIHGVAQLREAMAAGAGGEKRPRGHPIPQQAQSSSTYATYRPQQIFA